MRAAKAFFEMKGRGDATRLRVRQHLQRRVDVL
jgi:hypothetical protein